jgi:hypothetical protein
MLPPKRTLKRQSFTAATRECSNRWLGGSARPSVPEQCIQHHAGNHTAEGADHIHFGKWQICSTGRHSQVERSREVSREDPAANKYPSASASNVNLYCADIGSESKPAAGGSGSRTPFH